MKGKIIGKKLFAMSLGITIAASFVVCPVPAKEAIKTLKAGKTYSIDLNGEKREKVKYTTTESKNVTTFHLYVNGKKVFSKKLFPDGALTYVSTAKLVDINKNDKCKEIFLDTGKGMSDEEIVAIRYYSAKKIKYYSKYTGCSGLFYGNISLSGMKTPGNGTFYVEIDSPYSNASFGCYRMFIPAKLSGNAIKFLRAKEYKLSNYWKKWTSSYYYDSYTLNRNMTLYSDSACTKKKDTAYAGTQIKPQKLRVVNTTKNGYGTKGDFHVYVKTSDGKKGWLFFPKNGSGYLRNTPTWG